MATQTDYKATDKVGVDLYAVDTTQNFALGEVCKGKSATYGEAEFIYLKGVGSTVEGSWVAYDEAGVTALLAADAVGQVAIALGPTIASTYGWYQRVGKAAAKALTGFADNGKIYCTATPGSVDDAIVDGDLVFGAIGRSALDTPTTGMIWAQIDKPFVTDVAMVLT